MFEYGAEEGQFLDDNVYNFNVSEDGIYYVTAGDKKNELHVMKMALDGTQKEEIAGMEFEKGVRSAAIGVGKNILALSVHFEPALSSSRYLFDMETGEYVLVEKDDSLVIPDSQK